MKLETVFTILMHVIFLVGAAFMAFLIVKSGNGKLLWITWALITVPSLVSLVGYWINRLKKENRK